MSPVSPAAPGLGLGAGGDGRARTSEGTSLSLQCPEQLWRDVPFFGDTMGHSPGMSKAGLDGGWNTPG